MGHYFTEDGRQGEARLRLSERIFSLRDLVDIQLDILGSQLHGDALADQITGLQHGLSGS